MSTREANQVRIFRQQLIREARIDVKSQGFITSSVSGQLERNGVDVAQLERDLLDEQDTK